MFRSAVGFVILGALTVGIGCHTAREAGSPARAGLNTRDLIDPAAQAESEDLTPTGQLAAAAEFLRKERKARLEEQSKREGGQAPGATRSAPPGPRTSPARPLVPVRPVPPRTSLPNR